MQQSSQSPPLDPYEVVAEELQQKSIKPGLWTRAYSEAGGDEARARALYIQYRVAQLALAPSHPQCASASDVAASSVLPKNRGLGRGGYFLSIMAIGCAGAVIRYDSGQGAFIAFALIACTAPIIFRLRDIGTSGWWFISGLIPVVNLVLGYFLLAAPTGYAHHRKPDTTMKMLSVIFLLMIAIPFAVMFGAFLLGASTPQHAR